MLTLRDVTHRSKKHEYQHGVLASSSSSLSEPQQQQHASQEAHTHFISVVYSWADTAEPAAAWEPVFYWWNRSVTETQHEMNMQQLCVSVLQCDVFFMNIFWCTFWSIWWKKCYQAAVSLWLWQVPKLQFLNGHLRLAPKWVNSS